MTILSRVLSCVATCGALVLAPAASADFHTIGYAAGSQQFGLSTGGTTSAGGFQGTWDGSSMVFWCVELSQTFSFGADYVYSPSLPDDSTFTLLGKLFHEAFGASLTDATHSAAFQLAVWEIFFDSGSLDLHGGGFQVVDAKGNGATVTLAQQWLNGLSSSTDDVNVYYLVNDGHQNFITNTSIKVPRRDVPEPSSILLIALGLGAAWVALRRRRGTMPTAA